MGAGNGRRSDRVRTSRAEIGQGGRSKANSSRYGNGPNSQSSSEQSIPSDEESKCGEDDEHFYFQCSEFPVTNTLFDSAELASGATSYDCLGAPYCGMVAIDTALKRKRDFRDYEERTLHVVVGEEPNVVGTPSYLRSYALERGVNLAIYNTSSDLLASYNLGSGQKWVQLLYLEHHELVNDVDCVEGFGHYTLITAPMTTHTHVPDFTSFNFSFSGDNPAARWWLNAVAGTAVAAAAIPAVFGKTTRTKVAFTALAAVVGLAWSSAVPEVRKSVEFTPTLLKSNDTDTRNIVDKRDTLKYQEAYCLARTQLEYNLTIGPKWCSIMVPLHQESCPDRVVEMERFKVISSDMSKHVHLKTPHADLNSYSSVREINCRSDCPQDAASTISVLSDYAYSLSQDTPEQPTMRGLVQYNTLGDQVAIPDIRNVAANQFLGAGQYTKTNSFGLRRNHVMNSVWKDGPDVLKLVAVAPLGPLVTADGVVTAGAIGVTDSRSTISAFIGRAMTKDPGKVDIEAVKGCVETAKTFFTELISTSEIRPAMRGGSEFARNVAAFRESYTGKRAATWIEQRVQMYESYHSGTMTPRARRKFTENGFFVKFESNMKVRKVDGRERIQGRTRGIMQMSLLMMFENAQAIALLHQLYRTKMARYQVKGMTSTQMCAIIMRKTSNGSMVTDASAFESSLGERLREIEKHVMRLLCERAGLPELYLSFCRHTDGYRRLKTRWGTLMCCTRDSGDYWTSAFNGVQMLSLALWCAHLLDKPLDVIVEGDDGLVATGAMCPVILAKVGIKFSSELIGTKPGDVDFLRSLWQDGKRYLVVGRCLGILWVKKAAHLSRGKQLYLLRMAALSLYHLSPGHPVLTALINRINRETKHVKWFKNCQRYVDTWKGNLINDGKFPDDIKVDESMRPRVAEGAVGFPGIPVSIQLELERMFKHDSVFYVARALDAYEDVSLRSAVANGKMDNSNTDFLDVLEKSGIRLEGSAKRSDPLLSGHLRDPPNKPA